MQNKRNPFFFPHPAGAAAARRADRALGALLFSLTLLLLAAWWVRGL
ncbi:hypothetical protein [Hymenobacter nivis]|nr:hypothetical protein [Hymenobacter nivis]